MNDMLDIDMPVLCTGDQENLVRAIEFALPITSRAGLFLWSQTYLRALVAHEILMCAYGDARGNDLTMVKVATWSLSEMQVAEITDPRLGYFARGIEVWHNRGGEPVAVYPGMPPVTHEAHACIALQRHLGSFVLHGARDAGGTMGAYFLMAHLRQPFGARHAYLLNLMMPYMRAALERVLSVERSLNTCRIVKQQARGVPTGREIEILRWVQQGKSNAEIGVILKISPYTVKNHVQNILKKLQAQSRAEAVSRAMSMNLLR